MSSAYFQGPRTIFPAPRDSEPVYLPPEAACPEFEPDRSLGGRLIEGRERRGLTLKQAASESKIPAIYVEMMESGNHSAIPDQLYLLAFFRRYAEFLEMDVAEVTASFMRDFEAEENAVIQIPQPSRTIALRALPWRRIARTGVIVGAALSIAAVGFRLERRAPSPALAGVQEATASSPAPLASLAPVAPLAPLAAPSPLAAALPVAAIVPVAAIASPARSASARPTAAITTAKASQATHRPLSSAARRRRAAHRHHVIE
jgi:cytoskeletal protein RodZ